MHNLPLNFKSEAQANSDFEKPWIITSEAYQAVCAVPKEFGGYGGGFSPEDLFLQAAINCFVGTFKVIAKLSKVQYENIHVSGNLVVDKNSEGKTVMHKVHLNIQITGCEKPDRLQTIVVKTIKDGFILNSIKSEISYTLNLANI